MVSVKELLDQEPSEDDEDAHDTWRRSLRNAEQEELKSEIWACGVGDLLKVTKEFEVVGYAEYSPTERIGPEIVSIIPVGRVYRAVALKGRGWDLQPVNGEGPEELRIMNAQIPTVFKVLKPEKA